MSLEIIGMIGAKREGTGKKGAEVHVIGGGIDGDYITEFAQAHEKSGFDNNFELCFLYKITIRCISYGTIL